MRLRLSLRSIAAALLALAAVPALAQVNADLAVQVSESSRSMTYGRTRTYTVRLTSAIGRCATTAMTTCNPFGTNTCPVVSAGPPVVREACNATTATTARNVALDLTAQVAGAVVGLPTGCAPSTFSCSVTTATSCNPDVADACPFLVVNGQPTTRRESCDPNPFPCDVGNITDGSTATVTFTQAYPVPRKFFCSTSGAACTPDPALVGGSNCPTGETCDEDPDRRWEGEACGISGPFVTSLTASADNIAAPVVATDHDFVGRCSVHRTTTCATSADCPTGETCGTPMVAGSSVDVKYSLSGPASANEGQSIDFTADIRNLGPCAATDVEVDWDPAVGNSAGMTLTGSNLGAPLGLLSDATPSAQGCDLNPADDGAESDTSGVCSVTDTQACNPSVDPTTCPGGAGCCPTDEDCIPDRLAYSIYGVCYTGPIAIGATTSFTASFTVDPLLEDVISHSVWNSISGQALAGTGLGSGGGLFWDGTPRFDPVLGNNAPNTYTVVKNNKTTGCSSAGGVDGASLLALLGLTGLAIRRRRS